MTHNRAAISTAHHGASVRRKKLERLVLEFVVEINRGGDPAIHGLRLKAEFDRLYQEGRK